MLVSTLNKVLRRVGYTISPTSNVLVSLDQIYSNSGSHAIFSYTKEDGSFDYDRYRAVQEKGNKEKITQVWAIEDNISFLSDYLKRTVSPIKSGICHGTRRGKEQEWFKKYIGNDVDVIGTEISDTANDFPDTIQWDFHEVKPEWKDAMDFIYSNSFDHSYDPEKCLNAWMSCIRKGGVCILEHTNHHEAGSSRELDPFGAHLVQMPILISKWGAGKYGVREMLKGPVDRAGVKYTAFIIIERY